MTLEELLNKLIEKGWKPRWLLNEVEYIKAFKDVQQWWRVEISYEDHWYYKSIREILSKKSWLWQFVCENGMINVDETEVYYFWLKRKWVLDRGHYYLREAGENIRTNNYEYRLIESALCDEDKLEEFLLDNIKIW